MDLKKKAAKGVLWNFGGSLSTQGIGFVISIFLARLLSPEEFGIVAMSMVFIAMTQVFTDFGFASALVQNKKNTSLTYSSIFYINIAAGFILCGIFQLIAPIIGNFYNNPLVTILVRLLALNYIFSSFNLVQHTILRKNLNFRVITLRDLSSQLISGVIGIGMALKGFGVYALVAQTLINSLINTLFLWKVSDWYPKLEFSLREVKNLMSFSTFLFFDQITTQLFNRLDIIFIAKVFSPTTLGFYSRSQTLNSVVTTYSQSSLTNVFYPVLSTLQDDDIAYKRVFNKVVSVVCFVSFLLTGILFIWGKTIFVTLFGIKWLPSVPIFMVLVLSAFSFSLNSIQRVALLSKGKSKENFLFGLIQKSSRMLPLIIGFYFGIISLTWGIVIILASLTIANMVYLQRKLHIDFWMQFKKAYESIIILILLVVSFPKLVIFQNELFNAITYTVLFFVLFIGWNLLIKTEAISFLIENGKPFLKKALNKVSLEKTKNKDSQ